MRGIMVVIEGLDLTGKTTIAKTLSDCNDWQYYKTPPEEYYCECVKLGVDGFPVYSEERFRLFMECLKYSSWEILALLDKGISIVVDRWVWTTLAYHFAFNGSLEERVKKTLGEDISSLTKPDISFLVYVAENNVYELRKSLRKELTPHDRMVVNDKEKREAVFHNFKRLNPDFVCIDNSGEFDQTIYNIRQNISAHSMIN